VRIRVLRLLGPSIAAALATLTLPSAALATTVTRQVAAEAHAKFPAQVYAPFSQTYLPGSIYKVAKESRAHHLTLAFIQTAHKGSCTPTWDGDPGRPLSARPFLGQIKMLQHIGGNVIPAFGGDVADSTGTEIADSCTSVRKIAAAYELLVTRYHLTRLDMDVETGSLHNRADVKRRNKAIAMAQHWAAHRKIRLEIDFSIPVFRFGLSAPGIFVLRNAIASGVHVNLVSILAFDYYRGKKTNMGTSAVGAAVGVHNQLHRLLPRDSGAQLWHKEGITLLPGIDDAGSTETTSTHDAAQVMKFAVRKHMGLLSIWALQRDNGGCPGTPDGNTCSGIRQGTWAFSRRLEGFTR
jgi:hypothetical protein